MNSIASLMHWHPILYSAVLLFAGTTGTRVLVYVSKKMPPLGKDAGFWETWIYNLMKGASGLDPNKSLVNPRLLLGAGVEKDVLVAAGVPKEALGE